jgi:hypothetical protein
MNPPAYQKLCEYICDDNFKFNLEEQPLVEDFQELIQETTTIVAECVLNTDEHFPVQRKKDGSLKKQRELYDPDNKDYNGKKVDYITRHPDWNDNDNEWLYLIAYDNRIVKIGMTISSLEDRYKSYSCGTTRAMEKGSCSTTNYIITECNFNALKKGMKVEIIGIKCPFEKKEITRFGVTKTCKLSSVRDQETMITECFKNVYKHKPVLCVQEGK